MGYEANIDAAVDEFKGIYHSA